MLNKFFIIIKLIAVNYYKPAGVTSIGWIYLIDASSVNILKWL